MKNPFVNAFLAALYIVGIVFIMFAFTSIKTLDNTPLLPIGMIGLFVLSAATMGFLFAYEPFRLYFEGEKKAAFVFFLKTLATFAVLVILYVGALLLVFR